MTRPSWTGSSRPRWGRRMASRSTFLNVAEGAALVIGYAFFRMLPVDWASGLGGFLARKIGPRLGITKRAEINLSNAMPELSAGERRRVIAGMWDNLGRVIAEYPHLDKFRLFDAKSRIEGIDAGNILATRDPQKKYIFFSAHYGNWEIAIRTASQAGFEVTGVYRAPNNPIVDRFMLWARGVEAASSCRKATSRRARPSARCAKAVRSACWSI